MIPGVRDFIVVALTVFFVTYVWTRSAFPPVKVFRQYVLDRFGNGSSPAYLVTCPWCAGFWIAVLVTAVTAWTVGIANPVLVAPAAAAVTGLLQVTADVLERVDEFFTPSGK